MITPQIFKLKLKFGLFFMKVKISIFQFLQKFHFTKYFVASILDTIRFQPDQTSFYII